MMAGKTREYIPFHAVYRIRVTRDRRGYHIEFYYNSHDTWDIVSYTDDLPDGDKRIVFDSYDQEKYVFRNLMSKWV